VIAHSCGVREPRQLRRFHARIVAEDGRSISLEKMYAAHATAPIDPAEDAGLSRLRLAATPACRYHPHRE